MNFYEFATNSPWLTFFLAMILGDVIVKISQALILRHKVDWTKREILSKDQK